MKSQYQKVIMRLKLYKTLPTNAELQPKPVSQR